MGNYKIFITEKKDGSERIVALLRNKGDNSYSFVNLTTGVITKCRFKSEKDALKDLRSYVDTDKIEGYRQVSEEELYLYWSRTLGVF